MNYIKKSGRKKNLEYKKILREKKIVKMQQILLLFNQAEK